MSCYKQKVEERSYNERVLPVDHGISSDKQKGQYKKWTFPEKNKSLNTPFSWKLLRSTFSWESKPTKSRA